MAITKKNVILKDGPDTALYPQPCIATSSRVGGMKISEPFTLGSDNELVYYGAEYYNGQIILETSDVQSVGEWSFDCTSVDITPDIALVKATQQLFAADDSESYEWTIKILIEHNGSGTSTFSSMDQLIEFIDRGVEASTNPSFYRHILGIPVIRFMAWRDSGQFLESTREFYNVISVDNSAAWGDGYSMAGITCQCYSIFDA